MSKSIIILRHAKSNWINSDIDDHERPLSSRGYKNAREMAEFLKIKKYKPDYRICSSAKRAILTLGPIIEMWPDIPVNITNKIYLASSNEILMILKKQIEYSKILIIGHNPGLANLLSYLIDINNLDYNDELSYSIKKLPTCSLAMISLEINYWKEIFQSKGSLKSFITPKDIS